MKSTKKSGILEKRAMSPKTVSELVNLLNGTSNPRMIKYLKEQFLVASRFTISCETQS